MNVLAQELSKYYEDISPNDFWRSIFGDGELDTFESFTPGKYVAIAAEITNTKKGYVIKRAGRIVEKEKVVVYRYTVTDDLDVVDELLHSPHFCVMAPISYVGKSRASKNARVMYALCVELDYLRVGKNGEPVGLLALMDRYADYAHYIPKPTFIVASGNGLHLYYQFERPIVLYKNTVESLRLYKEELTKMIWTKSVTYSYTNETIQQESIFQAFRMPGTLTKSGDRTVAFRVGEPVSIDYLNSFLNPNLKGSKNIDAVYKSPHTLQEAKAKYPEWFEKVVVNGDHSRKEWAVNRAVYDWWLREIEAGAVDGHRYYCLKMLAIYAIKCGNYDPKKNPNPVTQEEFEADAWGLMEEFDSRTKNEDNHFSEFDVMCAIQVYEDRGMITYPRNSIANRSGITITPNKRNYQKQEWHLEDIRTKKANMKRRGQEFKNPEGRPKGSGTKQQLVQQYRMEHPEASVMEVSKILHMSRTTVYKWWDVDDEVTPNTSI